MRLLPRMFVYRFSNKWFNYPPPPPPPPRLHSCLNIFSTVRIKGYVYINANELDIYRTEKANKSSLHPEIPLLQLYKRNYIPIALCILSQTWQNTDHSLFTFVWNVLKPVKEEVFWITLKETKKPTIIFSLDDKELSGRQLPQTAQKKKSFSAWEISLMLS